MARKAVTSIELSGPFFRKDPVKTFRQNVRVLLAAAAAEGEADVRTQMRAGQSGRAPIHVGGGRVSDHVHGRVANLHGKRWAVTAVVSVNNRGLSRAQGISLMAAASSVERQTHAFRRTAGRIRRSRKVNTGELTKGLT